ncbi:MAG: SWIM zinc finger family protein [Reyranella sp.]|nr:SWIM zinc finger family protein [Reyranella sp.]
MHFLPGDVFPVPYLGYHAENMSNVRISVDLAVMMGKPASRARASRWNCSCASWALASRFRICCRHIRS